MAGAVGIGGGRVRVEVSGLDEVLASIRRLGKAGEEAGKRVLGAATKRIVPKAKALCPVEPAHPGADPGALRDSIRDAKPTITKAGRISAAVVAGGAPLKASLSREGHKFNVYAYVQHEDLTLHHTSGQGKFVEIPFMAEAQNVPDELMAELDAVAAAEGV